MDYLDKIVIAPLPLLIAFLLKAINHFFNLTGDKDKISKEKIDLLKSILELDRPLSQQKYKILFEEAFTLVYKKNIYFDEIKALLKTKSPKNAIHNYLLATPYVVVDKAGVFKYTIPNRLALYGKSFPIPLFSTMLLGAYAFFACLGLWLIMIGFNVWGFPIFQNSEKNANAYIYFFISEVLGVIFMWIALKSLVKMFNIPSKNTLIQALGNIKDNIISYPRITPEQVARKK
ncbi:MAG: hypothetical protein V4660_17660 [Pseudomonadota bacterium]